MSNQAGVASLPAFTVLRREARESRCDVLVGRLSGAVRDDLSSYCLIGLHGSWIWIEALEDAEEPSRCEVSTYNCQLEEGDDVLYLLPPEFQPPIASLLLDPNEEWEPNHFAVGLSAVSPFVDTDGKRWIHSRPITDASELQDGETLESGGWDHEHCSVCNKHVYPGDAYYSHAFMEGRFFLCEFCHRRFAAPHVIDVVIYPGFGLREGEED